MKLADMKKMLEVIEPMGNLQLFLSCEPSKKCVKLLEDMGYEAIECNNYRLYEAVEKREKVYTFVPDQTAEFYGSATDYVANHFDMFVLDRCFKIDN